MQFDELFYDLRTDIKLINQFMRRNKDVFDFSITNM